MEPFDQTMEPVRVAESLSPLNWFRLGGPAQFFARPSTTEALTELLERCRDADLSWRVIASGSNILVRDQGVKGLVIQLESPSFADVAIEGNEITAGAAVPLTALISQAARSGLSGLESLTGIPGTVGGAVRGNSGGRQGSIGPLVHRVMMLDPNDGSMRTRERDDLLFSYRQSNLDDGIILSVTLGLEADEPEDVVRRMRRIWILKKENQPYGHQSSGCIFKNPTPEVSAGALIEQAGLKGKKVGSVEVSDRHANYIVAQPGASSAEVLQLIDLAREEVMKRFGYELELQIQVW